MPRQHFHTLDALRFFAFLKVFLLHLPYNGHEAWFIWLKSGGGIGVEFFFTLSGFLITWLLITEKNKQQLNPVNFFLRRAFRIWPLYFLLLAFVYLIPYPFAEQAGLHATGGYIPDWRFSFSFIENIKMIQMDGFPRTTPLPVFWSLCIEEQFYILWIIVFSLISLKRIPFFLTLSLFIAPLARTFELFTSHNLTIQSIDLFTNLDAFSAGGLLAYLYVVQPVVVKKFTAAFNPTSKRVIFLLIITYVLFHKLLFQFMQPDVAFVIKPTITSLIFFLTLAFVIADPTKPIVSENSWFTRLGKLSYGLYMLHLIPIHLLLKVCQNSHIPLDQIWQVSLLAVIAFAASFLLSILSYRYLEGPFLRLRNHLTK